MIRQVTSTPADIILYLIRPLCGRFKGGYIMKKRLLSLLLCICLVCSLMTGLSVSASADGDTITHIIVAGDSLWQLCTNMGLNYEQCKNAIMILNGYKSDYQLSHLTIGDKVVLPTSAEAAARAVSGGASAPAAPAAPTTPTTTTTPAAPAAPAGVTLKDGDTVSYYLIAYKMNSGDIVSSIYSSWKMDYSPFANEILGINNLSGFNKMYAGRTYLFPVSTLPSGYSAAYSVIAHKVAAGDIAYDLCRGYSINYDSSKAIIKGLNKGSDLSSITAGQIIYLPAAGTGTGGSGDPGTTPGTTPGTNPGAAVSYPINCMSTTNGGFVAKVGNTAVSSAVAGSTVSIVATPNSGYSVYAISVSKAGDSSTNVATNSSSFVMPEYAVNISVTFKLIGSNVSGTQHKISIDAAENGKVSAIVNGAAVSTSAAGTFVTIVAEPNEGYDVESVKAYSGTKELTLTSNAFNMPDEDVRIVATFKAQSTYSITGTSDKNGSVSFTVDGKAVTSARAGQTVTIVPAPNKGFALKTVSVRFADGTAVPTVSKLTFTMPSKAVKVAVTYDKAYGIYTAENSGTVTYYAKGVAVSNAVAGENVSFSVKAPAGYYVEGVEIYKGTKVADVKEDSDVYDFFTENKGSFEMPAFDIIVIPSLARIDTYALEASYDEDACSSVKFLVNGCPVKEAAEGEKVTVVAVAKEGYAINSITSAQAEVDSKNSFKMPAEDVEVNVDCSIVEKQNIVISYNEKRGTPAIYVDGKKIEGSKTADGEMTFAAYPGKEATVSVECKPGFAVNSMKATSGGKKLAISDTDTFVVPNADVSIKITFRGIYLALNAEVSEHGTYTLIDSNGQSVAKTVAAGSTVYVKPVADEYYQLDKVTISYLVDGKTVTKNITEKLMFAMPGSDVTLKVTFKAITREIKSATVNAPEEANAMLKVYANNKHQTVTSPLAVPAFSNIVIEPVLPVAGYSVKSVTIKDAATGITLNKFIKFDLSTMTFEMPTDFDVEIIVEVVAD